jgi:hypothetical protein
MNPLVMYVQYLNGGLVMCVRYLILSLCACALFNYTPGPGRKYIASPLKYDESAKRANDSVFGNHLHI